MPQTIYKGCRALPKILRAAGAKKLLLVCGGSYDRLELKSRVDALGIETVRFSGFSPNPRYEDICAGVGVFNRAGCDGILAVGGGSAIDTAKCIKLYCRMDPAVNYLEQEPEDTGVPLIAAPTTAGSGAESTKNAILYYKGAKQSVSHFSMLPDYALLEPSVLKSLPVYQKKCTALDALCQGIESWWSVHSTEESKALARAAVKGVAANLERYVDENDAEAAAAVMEAANLAGQAINITATTAPHAMSYQLTMTYGLPHGHAVALGMAEVWTYMTAHTADCTDSRGEAYLQSVLDEIAAVISPERYCALLQRLGMTKPASRNREADLETLVAAVAPERLKNNPVALGSETLYALYGGIVTREDESFRQPTIIGTP